ncbi:hypothetical protein AB0J80_24630 [Actinoplanes sp. NPDC049548]|uniref:SCO4225 family membrane protein n=1 Tax=Actinoplanes sp. NPDC049548 TaxID=3155152 RepID=UPI00341463DF
MKILRWFVGSWIARIYLTAVGASIVWAFVEIARWGQPTADFALMWTMLMTAPWSYALLTIAARWDGNDGVFIGCIAAAALVNAALLNGVALLVRGPGFRRTSSD